MVPKFVCEVTVSEEIEVEASNVDEAMDIAEEKFFDLVQNSDVDVDVDCEPAKEG